LREEEEGIVVVEVVASFLINFFIRKFVIFKW